MIKTLNKVGLERNVLKPIRGSYENPTGDLMLSAH